MKWESLLSSGESLVTRYEVCFIVTNFVCTIRNYSNIRVCMRVHYVLWFMEKLY